MKSYKGDITLIFADKDIVAERSIHSSWATYKNWQR
jgi:hypothetical protein